MKKIIAIVAGGDSSEMEVSMRSADGIFSFLDKTRYTPYIVCLSRKEWFVRISDTEKLPIDKNDFSFVLSGKKILFDYAYITIHGTPGENGLLQGYFELIALHYSTCDALAAALTFNKFACNRYLKGFGVNVSNSLLLRKGQSVSNEEIIEKIGLPCFVKPNAGGSSFGVTKVKTAEQILSAIAKAFAEGDETLIETFMAGTEITCGMYKTHSKTVVFPVSEVVSRNEFFDYEAKYQGAVEEITPARISPALTARVQRQTAEIYDILGCRGIIRVDYIIGKNETINLLEVNTTPGMTATSFIPQQVRVAGLDIKDVLTEIIES